MEDDQKNGRRLQHGRRPKKIKMEDDQKNQNGRQQNKNLIKQKLN